MSRRNLAWLLGIAAVSLLGLAVSQSAPSKEKNQDYELVKLVVDVLDEVDHNYVRELDSEGKRKFVEDMINGGLERLDPHSGYINPRRYKQFSKDSKGEFGGVGIQIHTDRQTNLLQVVSPLVGTPAYEAGILAGDLIVKIDGKSTENMQVHEAVDLIQGEPGQKITLTVIHEGTKDPVDIEMARDKIHVQSVLGDLRKPDNPKEWEYFIDKENKIAYIRINQFHEPTATELRKVVEQLQKDGVRGLILDLRFNPGGLLLSAVEVSDMFLTEGRIVSTRGREQDAEKKYDAKEDATLLQPAKGCPMVVLVNRYSASASEIVAAALQDHQRALIIGERTYGKGSVQNVIKMEHGSSALKLTTASYWRPNGKNIHRFTDAKDTDDWGVKPDNAGYKLTEQSVEALKKAGVPDDVVGKLKTFPTNTRFSTDKEYLDELAKVLSEEEVSKNRAKFLEHADRGYEVPLKDEDRLEYMIWRRDRDIVHGKPGVPLPPKPKTGKEKDKEKKPFVDKVMEKALDYLRSEIKKAEAPLRLPEVGVG